MTHWTALGAIATGAAAVTTAVAAGFTAWMATETKKAARAAQDSVEQSKAELKLLEDQTRAIETQAKIAQRSLSQGSMPLLIPVSANELAAIDSASVTSSRRILDLRAIGGKHVLQWSGSDRGCWAASDREFLWPLIEMRNVGEGLAVVRNQRVDLSEGALLGRVSSDYVTQFGASPISSVLWPQQSVIPPGESTYFVGRIDDKDGTILSYLQTDGSTNHVLFTYQDLSRTSTYTVSFDFSVLDRMILPGATVFTGYDLGIGSERG